ncbi:C40 family peptidase [Candidatus Wolfebacteria bacterium]|nr:C40 family peptidase [Candidatus Wolfebacteria bacterium]
MYDKRKKIEKIIATARNLIGAPYKYGAYTEDYADNQTAFDCSSFIQFIFKRNGTDLPRSTVLQAATKGKEIGIENIRAGDLIFFEGNIGHYRHDLFPGRKIYIGHAVIYIGDNKIIHACDNAVTSGVVEYNLNDLPNPPYNIVLIKRYL